MPLGDWARRVFSRRNIEFAFGVLSPFLVWGLLILWAHWTMQAP